MAKANRAKMRDTGDNLFWYYVDMELVNPEAPFPTDKIWKALTPGAACLPSGAPLKLTLGEDLSREYRICRHCGKGNNLCVCSFARKRPAKDAREQVKAARMAHMRRANGL